VIPEVTEKGRVNVEAFVHPVLAIEKRFETESGQSSNSETVVPIDLMMPGQGSYQALMISGPNSGGKTLSLKSFGLAAIMAKLALPIPVARVSKENPTVVDFFRDIDVEVGDNQSLSSGESTLMARLNSLSALIEKSSARSFTSGCEYFEYICCPTDCQEVHVVFHLIKLERTGYCACSFHSSIRKTCTVGRARRRN
jgi:DNA mismatch repair protein MutS2